MPPGTPVMWQALPSGGWAPGSPGRLLGRNQTCRAAGQGLDGVSTRTREQPLGPPSSPGGTPVCRPFLGHKWRSPWNCHSLELTAARGDFTGPCSRVCTRAHGVHACGCCRHSVHVLSTRSVRPLHAQRGSSGGLCSKPNGQPCWGCAHWPIVQSLPSAEASLACLQVRPSPWVAG